MARILIERLPEFALAAEGRNRNSIELLPLDRRERSLSQTFDR